MTIYALGTALPPFHDISSEFAASAAARQGTRPSSFQSLIPPSPPFAPDTTSYEDGLIAPHLPVSDLTKWERNQIWVVLVRMWDHEPSHRPSVAVIRKHIALNGLIPLPPLISPSSLTFSTLSPIFALPESVRTAAEREMNLDKTAPSAPNSVLQPREEYSGHLPWYLKLSNGSNGLIFSADGAVKSGTLDALVEWLVTPRCRMYYRCNKLLIANLIILLFQALKKLTSSFERLFSQPIVCSRTLLR